MLNLIGRVIQTKIPTVFPRLPSFYRVFFFYLVFADLISESVSFIGRRRCFFLLGLRRLFFFRLVSRSRSDWIELMFLLCAGRYLFIFFKSLGFLFLFLPMETELDVPFYPQSDRVVCVCVRWGFDRIRPFPFIPFGAATSSTSSTAAPSSKTPSFWLGKLCQTQSNPVKPSQTQSNPVKPSRNR